MALIPVTFGAVLDSIGIVIFSVIIAYLLGLLLQNKTVFYKICDAFHIYNSVSDCIWDDILDFQYPSKLIIYTDKLVISGYVHFTENHENLPKVTLAGYLIQEADTGKTIENNQNCSNKVLFYDLSKADRVEIEYHNNSPMCEDVKILCNNTNNNQSQP